VDVPSGKPLADRQVDIPAGAGELAEWMAAPPPEPAVLEPRPGELAPPGAAAVRNYVDIPAQP
jgi:hypothetical protein